MCLLWNEAPFNYQHLDNLSPCWFQAGFLCIQQAPCLWSPYTLLWGGQLPWGEVVELYLLIRLVELGALKKSGRYSHLMRAEFMGMAWLQRHG